MERQRKSSIGCSRSRRTARTATDIRQGMHDTASERIKSMKIRLDFGAFMPLREHETDAGADLRSPIDAVVPARGSCVIDTGVHIQLPHGHVGMLKSKSGLNVRHGITSEGVIDEGYTGSIKVKLYNNSDMAYGINRGDKITQLVIVPCEYVDFDLVDDLEDSERGGDGFGSTGK